MLVARVGAQAGFATVLVARVGAQAGFAGTVLAFRVKKQNIGSPRNPIGAVYSNWSQQLYDDLVFLAKKQ